MEGIKQYTEAEKLDPSLFFGISRMEAIYEKHGGKPDAPHRHDYYTVILVKEARGTHLIDFTAYELSGRQVYFIAPGQVHQLFEAEKSYGYAIVFSTQFLAENNIPLQFIEDLNLFKDYLDQPPLPLSAEEFLKLSGYSEEMLSLFHSSMKFNSQAIGAYLKLFFIHCNNLCSLSFDDHPKTQAASGLLKRFKELLNTHHASWHSAAEYAEALHISADHLNRVVKSLVGKTAKEMIQSRITLAAKRLLYFSDLSTKEIGYSLGFTEPANFSAFFKNCTGISPSKFRKAQ